MSLKPQMVYILCKIFYNRYKNQGGAMKKTGIIFFLFIKICTLYAAEDSTPPDLKRFFPLFLYESCCQTPVPQEVRSAWNTFPEDLSNKAQSSRPSQVTFRLQRLKGKIEGVQGSLTTFMKRAEDDQRRVAGQQRAHNVILRFHKSRLDDLQAKFDQAQASRINEQQLASISTKLTRLEAQIIRLQESSTNQDEIAELKRQITELQKKIEQPQQPRLQTYARASVVAAFKGAGLLRQAGQKKK